ncbi:hypothetical protein [Sabulibacter ruber]|uniref:hypothetical protein n=1 Tax=Sabulibacter ruber TaxID=2811901 RepID=UPI001A970345|nr:hypothetical protein [Sabulibacter ruber]
MAKHLPLSIFLLLVLAGCHPKAGKVAQNSSPLDAFKGRKPLIILDGRPIPQDSSLKQYATRAEIESVELIENSAESRDYLSMTYGAAAKDGVIKVTTNTFKAKLRQQLFDSLLERLRAYEHAPSTFLFVKDGFPMNEEDIAKLRDLAPSELLDVVSLKVEAAKAIYGSAARENTVLINTRSTGNK